MGELSKGKIVKFYRRYKRMPSYREIAELLGYRSKNAAYKAVDHLLEEGFVERDDQGRLIPGDVFNGVKVLGLVEAGFPSPAEEELADTMSLDHYLIDNPEATYLLKVKGDSMIEAGIQEGDMVIAERGSSPRLGEIVIAEVDGEYTMKYYRKKDGQTYLEPANRNYKPIYPDTDLTIGAVVRGVIRKY